MRVILKSESNFWPTLSHQVLELVCTREAGSVFEAGGLNCVLTFIKDNGSLVHKDTLHSAMAVVSRLCGKMEPQDASLSTCIESLSTLLKHEDNHVSFHDVFMAFLSKVNVIYWDTLQMGERCGDVTVAYSRIYDH